MTDARLKAAAEKWGVPAVNEGMSDITWDGSRPDLDVCMDILAKLPHREFSLEFGSGTLWTWVVFPQGDDDRSELGCGEIKPCVCELAERLSPVTDQEQV